MSNLLYAVSGALFGAALWCVLIILCAWKPEPVLFDDEPRKR